MHLGSILSSSEAENESVVIVIAVRLRRRGSELKIVLAEDEAPPRIDRSLLTNVALAFAWMEDLRTGNATSLDSIAGQYGITPSRVRQIYPFALLPPLLIEAIVEGRQPIEMTTKSLKRIAPLPMNWEDQMRALAIGKSPTGSDNPFRKAER